MQEEEIILEIFNSERNTLFIQTQNRILLIDLSDKPIKANVRGDMYINKIAAKDMLLNIRNSPVIFQSIKLDNYLNCYIDNDALTMRLDFIMENQIFDYKRNIEKTILAFKNSDKTVKLIDREKDIFAIIHTDEIQTLKMDDSMDKLVTICQNGQNINLWNINDLNDIKTEPEMKFYRGKNPCIITSISFNRESTLLALATDKGTIHIFDIKDYNRNVSSAVSWIPFASSLTNYANYKWSFGQIHLDQYVKDSSSIQSPVCQFNSSDLLIVCTPSGKYFEFFLDVSSSKFSCNCIKSNLLLSEKFFSDRCYFEQDHINFEILIKELIDSSNSSEVIPKKPKKKKSSKLVSTEKFIFPNVTNFLRNDNKNNFVSKSEEKLSLKQDVDEKGDKEKEEKIEIFEKIEIVERENTEKEIIEKDIINEEILSDEKIKEEMEVRNEEKEEEIEVLKAEVELKIENDEVIIEDNTDIVVEEQKVVNEEKIVLDEEKVVKRKERGEKEIKEIKIQDDEEEKKEVREDYEEEIDLNSEDDKIIEDQTTKVEEEKTSIKEQKNSFLREEKKDLGKKEVEAREVEEIENDNDEIVDDHHVDDEVVDEFEEEIREDDDEEITDTTGTEEEEHNEIKKGDKEEVSEVKMIVEEEKKEEEIIENDLDDDKPEINEDVKIDDDNQDDEISINQLENINKDDEICFDKEKQDEESSEKSSDPSPVLEQATKNFSHNKISDNRKSRTKSIARRPSKGHRTPGSSETKDSPVVVESPSQPTKKYFPQGVSNQFKLPPINKIALKKVKKSGDQSVPSKNN